MGLSRLDVLPEDLRDPFKLGIAGFIAEGE